MPEFGAALAPGNNFVAMEEARGFAHEFVFAREVVIGDFTVVEDSLDFLGIGVHAEGKSSERCAGGMACSLLECEISGAEGGATARRLVATGGGTRAILARHTGVRENPREESPSSR